MKETIFIHKFSDNNQDQITINDFKQLVINDLLEFVLTQNSNQKQSEATWAEIYGEWLEKKAE